MINIGDVNVGNEVILNFYQSQVYNEVLKKLENFGIAGYDIDHESYVIQKTLAKHISESVSPDEGNVGEIPRMAQVVFQTLTNPDLYDSDVVSEDLVQWIEIGNPYSFFAQKNQITDLSGNANDIRFPKLRVKPNGFRKNGTVIRKQIPSLRFTGKGSRLNATTVIDDVFQPEGARSNGLFEGTIETWVKLDKKKGKRGDAVHPLFHFHTTGTPFGLTALVYPDGGIQLHKFAYDQKEDGEEIKEAFRSYSEPGVVQFGIWQHIVVSFTKDGAICYVNTKGYKLVDGDTASQFDIPTKQHDGPVRGFTDGYGSLKSEEGEVSLVPDAFWIGAQRYPNNKFKKQMVGNLSSFRVYEKALDSEEVEQNFDSSKGQYTGE